MSRRAPHLVPAALVAASLLAGCASTPKPVPAPPSLLSAHPVVVMLPFANLSGRSEQGDIVTKVFYSELARTGAFDLVEMGEVERLIGVMRLRDTGAPTSAQVKALRDSTGARYVLAGTVLEAGTIHAPEGDIPSVGAALRLIDTESLRAVWADSRFRNGQDHESVFGWGRETSLSRLTSELAAEMLKSFRSDGAARDTARGGVR